MEAHLANNILVSQFTRHETMADANKGFCNVGGNMATIKMHISNPTNRQMMESLLKCNLKP